MTLDPYRRVLTEELQLVARADFADTARIDDHQPFSATVRQIHVAR